MYAVLSDCNEDGRSVRHVHQVFPHYEEARDFAKLHGLKLLKVKDEAEARSLEIETFTSDSDEWTYREEAMDRAEYERVQGYGG